jgi:glucose-6-phosphate 1-epimerase
MPQHGPMRNMPWTVLECSTSPNYCELQLIPQWNEEAKNLSPQEILSIQKSKQLLRTALGIEWHEIDLIQIFKLGNTLEQRLETRNKSKKNISITQALHSYFAVADAMNTSLKGFDNLFFTDKLQSQLSEVTAQKQDIQINHTDLSSIDRIYHLTHKQAHNFEIHDYGNQRVIQVQTIGSQSVVVWNPGAAIASQMQDVGEQQWTSFFCLEVANALPHAVILAPDQTTCLGQIIQLL